MELLKKVIGPNASWNTNKDRGYLTEHAKVWFYFMSSRLLPLKHVSTIYRDREVLLYSIIMNFKFNVGNIIQNSLLEGELGKSFIHSSLITQLCRVAKVVIDSDEERSPSMAPLPFLIEKPQEPRRTQKNPSRTSKDYRVSREPKKG